MKWQKADVDNWFGQQKIKRSYQDEVVSKIKKLGATFELQQYAALSQNPERYPLFLLRSKNFDTRKRTVLITGGVHGYETSGVHGALGFLATSAEDFEKDFNFVCFPCVSPWAYETINRWSPIALDPNRSFRQGTPVEESRYLLNALTGLTPVAHFDLHETTDTDNTVFRPDLERRDGVTQELWPIPDGFYVVGDTENPQKDFQKAVIVAVRQVTHIAPADEHGGIIGVKIEQEGVINYPLKELSLCAGITNAEYTTTTEVYPDSPKVNADICVNAQIAAIQGGLNFIRQRN